MVQICSETDPKAEVLFMFENGTTELIESEKPPLTLGQYEDYKRVGCHAEGTYLEGEQQFYWQWFGTFPLGMTRLAVDADFYPLAQTRLDISGSIVRLYFRGEFILERPYYSGSTARISSFLEYEYYQYQLQYQPTYTIGGEPRYAVVETNGSIDFDENNYCIFSYLYDRDNNFLYETPPMEHVYDSSCGDCDNLTQLKVGDDSSTGYRCLPYENLIEWAKQQRQILRSI